MTYSRLLFLPIAFASLIAMQSTANAKMYRWIDSNGKTVYSDKVPPKKAKLERKVLSKSGHVIDTVDAAKTREQIALEARLKILREEQEKIISKQKSNDKMLLSTFRNIDDLRMTLKGKLNSINSQKRIFESDLKNLKDDLSSAHKRAALAERKGIKVSVGLLKQMSEIEEKINSNYAEIGKVIEKGQLIEKKYNKEIERFIFLTKGNISSAKKLSDLTAETKAANDLGLYNCADKVTCAQAWEVAKNFVTKHSTTEINFNTDALIMSADPMVASDLSLSVSKSSRSNARVSIFLDIRCHSSTKGTALCASKQVNDVRRSFMSYIQSNLPK